MEPLLLVVMAIVGMVYNFIIALIVNAYSEKPFPVLLTSLISTALCYGCWYIWGSDYMLAMTIGSVAIPAGMVGFYLYAYWEIKKGGEKLLFERGIPALFLLFGLHLKRIQFQYLATHLI